MAVSTITITSGASTLIPTVEPVVLTLGTVGPQGVAGPGIPGGGTIGQIIAKTGTQNYATGWIDNYTTDVRIAAKNDSGTTLAKGTAVYVSGANGTNVLIKPAIASSDATSATTIGLTLQSMIPNNTNWVITQGTLSGINTAAATAGDPVWLSGTVAGGLVFGFANEPQAPTHLVYLGTVTRAHATLGSIEVKVNNGWELNELHNVKITSPTNGQVLTYDSANSLWINSSETGDISAVNVTAPITGGGTSGAVTIGIDQTALAIAPSQVTGTAVITTDPRLSDTRTPTDGTVTTAKIAAGGLATSAITGTAVITTDSRLSDARTPTAHASTHAAAGSDPVTLAQSQVTNLTTDLAGKAALGAANAFTVGGHTITNTVAATIPLKVLGAASQSGDLQQWQTSAAATVMKVEANGALAVLPAAAANGYSLFARSPSASVIGAIIRGAASQTANLQEWQASTGSISALVDAYGSAAFGGNNALSSSLGVQTAGSPSQKGITVRGAASQTANLTEWQNSAGGVAAGVTAGGAGFFGRGTAFASTVLSVSTAASTNIGFVVQGAASQSANLQEWQNSAGTILARVDASGAFTAVQYSTSNNLGRMGEASSGGFLRLARMTAQASSPGNNVGTLYLRDGTNAGTLKLVVRAGAAGAETTILDNIPQ